MEAISTQELKKKMKRGDPFALVEVLGGEQYEEFHLPGAINVPFDGSFAQKIQRAVPDKNEEVVVYCQNESCSASPNAGHEMERIGYRKVADYSAGKDAWRQSQ